MQGQVPAGVLAAFTVTEKQRPAISRSGMRRVSDLEARNKSVRKLQPVPESEDEIA